MPHTNRNERSATAPPTKTFVDSTKPFVVVSVACGRKPIFVRRDPLSQRVTKVGMPVDRCVRRTAELYDRITSRLRDVLLDDSPRGRRTCFLCTTAIEHGLAIRLLISAEQLASATALLRVQFETVVRANWLHFVASDAALDEPEDSVKTQDMLGTVDQVAPPRVGTMLRALEQAAWGLRLPRAVGGNALDILKSANGLTAIAAMLIAMLSGDERAPRAMRQIQADHADCLPSLAT